MKTVAQWVLLVAVAAGAGYGGYWYGAHHSGDGRAMEAKGDAGEGAATQPAEEDKPVVPVAVAPLKVATITETATAYGTVVAEAGDVRAVSVPFESRVQRVLVTPGQQVDAGAPLVRVEASPDALVALEEAKNAVEAAERDAKQTEERFAEHLATNQERSQAQQAVRSAKLKLESLAARGVGREHELKAEAGGIVNKVDVQEGQIVGAGGALVEVAAGNRIEVRLGVEPSDAAALKPGQAVRVRPVGGGAGEEPIAGTVRMIGQRVDPATRLVEVRVTPASGAHLMLETFVAGEIDRASTDGLVVPRDAALPDEDGTFTLFTVRDRHAVRHSVKVGLHQGDTVQVTGDDLKAGEVVVVSGNYLLKDGTEVEVSQPDAGAATGTATAPVGTGAKS